MKTSEELVKDYKSGDADALNELIRSYYPSIKNICRKYFLIGADDEDLVQECIIGLIRAVRSYEDGKQCSFQTYALVCMENAAKTAVRNYSGNKNKPLNDGIPLNEATELPSKEENPEQMVIDSENLTEFKDKSETLLSKKEREVFELYVGGLSYKEIEQATGKNRKSIENTLQRIRRKLRGALSEK